MLVVRIGSSASVAVRRIAARHAHGGAVPTCDDSGSHMPTFSRIRAGILSIQGANACSRFRQSRSQVPRGCTRSASGASLWTRPHSLSMKSDDSRHASAASLTSGSSERTVLLQGVVILFRLYVVGSCQVVTGLMTSAVTAASYRFLGGWVSGVVACESSAPFPPGRRNTTVTTWCVLSCSRRVHQEVCTPRSRKRSRWLPAV